MPATLSSIRRAFSLNRLSVPEMGPVSKKIGRAFFYIEVLTEVRW